MEVEGHFGNLIYIYLNILLCLLKHIDVSSRNYENSPYCSLRGGGRGEHQGKALTAPKGHHGTALGVPRTHRWAPRHV